MPDPIAPEHMAQLVVPHKPGVEGTVWNVGHSTHSFPEFLDILRAHTVKTITDVRRFPGSRRNPQFGAEPLSTSVAAHAIDYHWLSELGGRRHTDGLQVEGSAWRHPSFRAYAQHLQSEEFAQGLDTLLHVAKASRTAIMCSELLWWRCHRRRIADAMVFCGWQVIHILGATDQSEHRLAAPVSVTPEGLSYIAPDPEEPRECC